MPHITLAIQPGGPIAGFSVGISATRERALRAAHQPVPALIPLHALVDTGADGTFIDVRHLQPLDLPYPTFALVGTAAGTAHTFAPQYEVSLTISHPSGNRRANLVIPAIPVIDMQLAPHLGYEALIGRDVLERCLLLYDGEAGAFTLGY
ncbi:MAG TPA: hypothetical protein VK395_37950 [Gemmataceae bacterium]|nr:hypothetical protein [Gemmataceae bacterium]